MPDRCDVVAAGGGNAALCAAFAAVATGGLRITTDAEVIDTESNPIPGMYAAGELVGGIFYFNYPGGTGLTNGSVSGRIAGTAAAACTSPPSTRSV